MPYDPKPRIKSIEPFSFVAEDYEVINEKNIKVDDMAISKLFKDPGRYIIPRIFKYERDYDQGQQLMESDYFEIECSRIEVNGPKDIDFYCKPIPGTKVYRFYGPTFAWHLMGDLSGTAPTIEVIESVEE